MARMAGRRQQRVAPPNESLSRRTRATSQAENNIEPNTQVVDASDHSEPDSTHVPRLGIRVEAAEVEDSIQDGDATNEDDLLEGSDSSSDVDDVDYLAVFKRMTNNITVLEDRARHIIELFTSQGIEKLANLLKDDTSELYIELKGFLDIFRLVYRNFSDAPFISLTYFKKVVTNQRRPHLEASLIVVKANLALLMLGLTGHDVELERTDILELLTDLLPEVFSDKFIIHNGDANPLKIYRDPSFISATADFAVALITQLFAIECMESVGDTDFRPMARLDQLFLTDETNDFVEIPLTRTQASNESYSRSKMQQRYDELKRLAEEGEVHRLHEIYPAEGFVRTATTWMIEYNIALDTKIKACHGTGNIVQLLKNHVIEPELKLLRPSGNPVTPNSSARPMLDGGDYTGPSQQPRARTPLAGLDEANDEDSQSTESLQGQFPASRSRTLMVDTIPESPQPDDLGSDELPEIEDIRYPRIPEQTETDQSVDLEPEDQHPTLTSSGATNEPQNDVYVDESVADDLEPTPETTNVLQIAGKTNKENEPPKQRLTLLDSQPNAQRVRFDDGDEEAEQGSQQGANQFQGNRTTHDEAAGSYFPSSAASWSRPPPSGQGQNAAQSRNGQGQQARTTNENGQENVRTGEHKRHRGGFEDVDDDQDDDEDDHFQQTTRQVKKRRPEYAQSNVSRRVATDETTLFINSNDSSTDTDQAHEAEHQSSVRTPPLTAEPSTAPQPTQPPLPRATGSQAATLIGALSSSAPSAIDDVVDQHREAHNRAPENVSAAKAAVAATQPPIYRASKPRRQWTEAETRRLIQLMSEQGCAWSYILQLDKNMTPPLLQHRTQVNLKDKARNMKYDFLRSGMQLPECFVPVAMSSKLNEELRAKGIAVPDPISGEH